MPKQSGSGVRIPAIAKHVDKAIYGKPKVDPLKVSARARDRPRIRKALALVGLRKKD